MAQYTDALSKGDTKALGTLYTSGAIDFNPFGKLDDASKEMQITEKVHSMGLVEKANVVRVEPFGDQGMLVTATYTSTFTKDPKIPEGHGNLLLVLERDGNTWKIRAMAHVRVLVATSPPK